MPPRRVNRAVADLERRRDADNRKVRRALIQLRVGRRAYRIELDAGEDLVGGQIDGEEIPEEPVGLHGAPAPRSKDVHLRIHREHRRRVVGGGIRVREAAAERAAVPDLEVADRRGRIRDRGTPLPQQLG